MGKSKKGQSFGAGFKYILGLGMLMIAWVTVTAFGESDLEAIRTIDILMTLGGMQTYQDGIVGGAVLILIVGMILFLYEGLKSPRERK